MLKPGRKTATRSRTVDRYYAKLLATGQQQRKAARRHSKKDQKQEQIAAVALAYVKNEELKLAAAVVAMPPPPSFHDPYGYDITDAPAPKRRMVPPGAMSSPKARALKSCVRSCVYIPTPSPKAKSAFAQHKDTPDPRARLAAKSTKEAGKEFLRNSGVVL